MKIEDAGEYPFAEMGSSDTLRKASGAWPWAIPAAIRTTAARCCGWAACCCRLTREAITTDCTLVGGDSGGPLFDMDGRVIGINSRIAGAWRQHARAGQHVQGNRGTG